MKFLTNRKARRDSALAVRMKAIGLRKISSETRRSIVPVPVPDGSGSRETVERQSSIAFNTIK